MTRNGKRELDALRGVPLELTAVLGTRRMKLGELLDLGEGAVVALDHPIDAPVDVLAGGTLVARGEIVAVDDRLGIRITSVVHGDAA